MAPDADCESARLSGGGRVLPEQAVPTTAWAESEDAERSPGEHRRLLPPPAGKSRLQAGLTLGVHAGYPQKPTAAADYQRIRFLKRKEKLIEALKPPYFILSMIIVMVFVHTLGSEPLRLRMEWLPASWRQQPWRLLTYGMVHANPAHLALNALVALAVGWRLEREQGWWRAACVWWAGVAAGALGAGALQPAVKVVGASAAVYALLTAHLPNVCLRFGYIPLWWFRPLSVVVLGASEACWAAARAPVGESAHAQLSRDHVAWAAHLLGAVVGVPVAFIVFTGENTKMKFIIAARVLSALLVATGVALAIAHFAFWLDMDA